MDGCSHFGGALLSIHLTGKINCIKSFFGAEIRRSIIIFIMKIVLERIMLVKSEIRCVFYDPH